ncbi:MAG: substrate-binding domain-containing protein [Candidatus Poribacteria bacterium]
MNDERNTNIWRPFIPSEQRCGDYTGGKEKLCIISVSLWGTNNVPSDYAVIGFDGSEYGCLLKPNLTTVKLLYREIGQKLVRIK